MSAAALVNSLTLLASGALSQYRRVKRDGSGQAAYAGASDRGLGVLNDPVLAAGEPASILGYQEAAAIYMEAASSFAAGATVYAAANGKIDDTGTIEMGQSLDASSGDGTVVRVAPAIRETSSASGTTNDVFTVDSDATTPKIALGGQTGGTGNYTNQILPPATLTANRTATLPSDSDQTLVGATATQTLTNKTLTAPIVNSPVVTRKVTAKTGNYSVDAATDSGQTFTTVGAGSTVTFSLPAATVGQNYRFRVGAAQELRLDPNGTETIALPSTGVQGDAGKYLTADADGETIAIECTKAGQWSVFGFTGTWTAEP